MTLLLPLERTPWRLIRDGARTPHDNMAIDADLVERFRPGDQPILRLYRWDRECLSLGRFQKVHETIDVTACERAGLAWVQRPSGGKLVYHGRDLTYAVVVPRTSISTHRELFVAVHEAWARALQRVGVPVDLAKGDGPVLPTPDCFAVQVASEVLLSGSKVIGSAQRLTRHAVLQHGSLLLKRDPRRIAEVLVPGAQPGELREQAGYGGTWGEAELKGAEELFVEEMARGFAAQFGEPERSLRSRFNHR